MLEKRILTGGMNSDLDDRYIENGDYRLALNIRNSRADGEGQGTPENIKGNTLVNYTLPSGTNKCIGNFYDKVNNVVLYFVWNSGDNHSILEYSPSSGSITEILQSSLLNFNREYLILHIERIDNLLYWTDGLNEPRYLNINNSKTGVYTYGTNQYIDTIMWSPRYSPTGVYGSDANVTSNAVRGKLFQFRYCWVYDDGQESAYSPISKVILPESEGALFNVSSYYETSVNNFIGVTFETGIDKVKKIRLAVREGNNGDFYIVKTFDKSESGIANNINHTYNFFNNEAFTAVTQATVNRLYDYIPLKAECMSFIDGNRLVFSNITEGYDNLPIDVEVVPVYHEVPSDPASLFRYYNGTSYGVFTSNVVNAQETLDFHVFSFFQNNPSSVLTRSVTQIFEFYPNSLEEGQIITHKLNFNIQGLSDYFYSRTINFGVAHVIQSGDTAVSIINSLASKILSNSASDTTFTVIDQNGGSWTWRIQINAYSSPLGGVDRLYTTFTATLISFSYNPFNQSIDPLVRIQATTNLKITNNSTYKTLKRASKHGIGIVYYDNPNRSGLTQVSDVTDFFVEPYNNTVGYEGHVSLNLVINHTPPSWATHYQIVYTGNQSVQRYLQVDIGSAVTVTGDEMKIYINTIATYNTANNGKTELSYEFAKGDRVWFISDNSGDFYTTYEDVLINSSASDGTGQYILIDNVLGVTPEQGTLLQLYTPAQTLAARVYYEVGEVFEIKNGYHKGNTQNQNAAQPAILNLNIGDSYYRFRGDFINSFIEDFSFSDFYTSNYWDKGRPNRVDKDYKQIKRTTTSYYTEAYIPETNINGLSKVFSTSFGSLSHQFGEIKKTYSYDDRLEYYQQKRTGFAMVNKDVLYNATGTPQGVVGQQNAVIGQINYFAGDYGIGDNPESFAAYAGTRYHIDAASGVVLRLGGDGYTPISEYGMHNHFTDRFNELKSNPSGIQFKVWGVYDWKFGEYVLDIQDISKPDQVIENRQFSKGDGFVNQTQIIPGSVIVTGETIAYSELKNKWTTYYSYRPDAMVMADGILVTFKDGKLYTHNTNSTYNNFYGTQYTSLIDVVFNENPSNMKFYKGTVVEATSVFDCPSITNQFGQSSSLVTDDFEETEGVFNAAFLKDANTPNVTNPLIEGDQLRCHSLVVRYRSSSVVYTKIFSVGVHHENSELTNR